MHFSNISKERVASSTINSSGHFTLKKSIL